RHPAFRGVRPCSQGLVTEALLRLMSGPDHRLDRAVEFAASMAHECVYNDGLPCAWGAVKLLRAMAAIPTPQRSAGALAAIERGLDFLSRYDLAQADFPHGEAVSPEWFRFGFPRGHQSDVLETLETLARLGCPPVPRLEAAIDLVLSKRRADGCWYSEFVSPVAGRLGIDREGAPSKWITLRALYVLKWWAPASLTAKD
ncbi:MAG: hypothetical protein M8467_08860, partial [Anaerolineae bacterium]|nr:hypothetical protein [Anaerolineae bacterium]